MATVENYTTSAPGTSRIVDVRAGSGDLPARFFLYSKIGPSGGISSAEMLPATDKRTRHRPARQTDEDYLVGIARRHAQSVESMPGRSSPARARGPRGGSLPRRGGC